MIRFACPVCNKTYKADLGQAGRESLCKQCGSIVVVPERPIREVHYGVPLPPGALAEVVELSAVVEEPLPPPPPPLRQEAADPPRRRQYPEKYCHECGERIRARAEICPKCGVRQPGDIPYRSQRARDDADNKLVAGLCAILVGSLGVHKFILGTPVAGAIMLVVSLVTIPCAFAGMIVMTVIGIIEGVLYLSKSDREFKETYIRRKRAWF